MSTVTIARRLADLAEHLLGTALPVGLRAWDGSTAGPATGPILVLNSRRALRRLLWRPGELGLARAYVSGDLDVDGDLKEGLRRCWAQLRQREPGAGRLGPAQWPGMVAAAVRLGVVGLPPRAPGAEAKLTGRLHAPGRDRAAIAHHYDLGNDFYELILEPHMAYSCGYWTSQDPGYRHTDAQRDKLDLTCRKLALRPGMRLLDVGCGWGSLLLYAARHYGVHATGITLSVQQRDFVRARIAEHGLADRVQVRLQDYRDLTDGPFDAVASIEMGEHVGEDNYPTYAAVLHRSVRPGGRVLIQQMARGAVAPGGGAFIESYVAPDMTMRPLSRTLGYLEHAGLEIRDVEAMREHGAQTIDAWAATLEQHWAQIVDRFGSERARVWRLYLAGAALAFEDNRMGVHQILAAQTTADGRSGMPATRQWITEPALAERR